MTEERKVRSPGDILKSLKNNCNMQASAHAYLRDEYRGWNLLLTILAILLTAALLPFALVADDFVTQTLHLSLSSFKVLNSITAFAAFAVVLVQLAWRPGALAASHASAVKHYTRAKLAIRRLETKIDVSLKDVDAVEDGYLDERDIPPIPEKKFIALKQWHLKKVANSKKLDEDPWTKVSK